MSDTQVNKYVKEIQMRLPTFVSPERSADSLKDFVRSAIGDLPPSMEANINEACAIVKARQAKVEILRPSSITKRRPDWYRGPIGGDKHWPALEGYLRNEKKWSPGAVESIADTSSEVVSLLANPAEDQFCCRGLVVGYVQSGKTANMTAVISKAVDAGYNLIVLLAGMTNKLRAQTQRRLTSDIVQRHIQLWQLYTTADDDGDFEMPPNGQFTMPVQGRAQLVVMKKISSRLDAFHKTIKETRPVILRELKVLLIDDECDQAGVNTGKSDYDMNTINEVIRKIIRDLPAVSYVGYTATPFANVFINPYPQNRDTLDDLYPEDFITALPKPSEYFGPAEVFGMDPYDASAETDEEAGNNMIHIIPEPQVEDLRPLKLAERETFYPVVTDCLADAILWFIASSAIRRERGHADSHMTMLVHTSPHIIQHERMAGAIGHWIAHTSGGLRAGKGFMFDRLEAVALRELERVPPKKGIQKTRPKMKEISNLIGEVLDELTIVEENSESEVHERLSYEGKPKTYIVIGGAVLARGLTLEGLCVSFFLRTSKQYDTLLQMGRWFGYRVGYEDLPRLWTTFDLESSFRGLAQIENEIRESIEVYRQNDLNPQEFAVQVRAIPGMAITSASKMRNAYRAGISYEGRHIQTIRYDHMDKQIVEDNWAAGVRLVQSIGAGGFEVGEQSGYLAEGVDLSQIRKFMMEYHICEEHMDLKRSLLLGFIDDARDRMPLWNVGIVQVKSGQESAVPFGPLGKLVLMRRSKLEVSKNQHYADIKALMSKRDMLLDAGGAEPASDSWGDIKAVRPDVPLLLLYPIEAKSPASIGSSARVALDAVGDLLGIGVVFPGEINRAGKYFSVQLEAPTPEQLDDEEIAEDIEEGIAK
jgi:hypothetical protein